MLPAAAAAAHLASRHTAHSLHHDNQVLSCSSLLTRLSTHQEAGAAPERDHLLWWLDSAETEQPLLAWYSAPAAGAGVLHTVLAGDVNAACSGGGGGYLGWGLEVTLPLVTRSCHCSVGALAGARSGVCTAPHPPHDWWCCAGPPPAQDWSVPTHRTQHTTAAAQCPL